MSTYPTPWSVQVRTHSAVARDTHGKPTDVWSGPGDPQPVYGWGPAGTSEPSEPNRSAVTHDLDLYVPPGFVCAPRDRIDVAALTYEVEGELEDFTHGPFGFAPGGRVRLRKVDG